MPRKPSEGALVLIPSKSFCVVRDGGGARACNAAALMAALSLSSGRSYLTIAAAKRDQAITGQENYR